MTRTPPPTLSLEERRAALEKAKESRQVRAEMKRGIRLGEVSIFDAINDPRESIRRMKVIDLLSSTPGIGKARATLIMERRKISLTRRIGGLGQLQLRGLGKELVLARTGAFRGKLIVISGPGGVGKSTITSQLRTDPRFWISVSATTRDPRPGERDGVDYLFFSRKRFQKMADSGEFLEWAEFAGNLYGTPQTPVQEWRNLGKHVILEIEIDGARQVRSHEAGALLIFIAPPSWEELVRRLTSRGTDSPERRAARLALAEEEMAAASEFDVRLINEKVDGLIAELVSLATA
jgi:guanylate kinase